MQSIFKTVFVVSFVMLAATVVHPCTCNFMKPEKKLRKARAVFVGEVVAVGSNSEDSWATVAIKFKVEKYWKGVGDPHITVVSAPGICCTCGLKVVSGAKYLIYAFKMENGQLETDLCVSRPVESEVYQEELRVLGKGKLPKPGVGPQFNKGMQLMEP